MGNQNLTWSTVPGVPAPQSQSLGNPQSATTPDALAEYRRIQVLKLFRKALIERGYKKTSTQSHVKVLSAFLKQLHLRNIDIKSIWDTLGVLNELLSNLEYSSSYRNSLVNVLRLYYQYVAEIFIPEQILPSPEREPKPPQTLAVHEVELMIKKTFSGPQELHREKQRCMVLLLYGTGIRTGELKRLLRKNVDFERQVLIINTGHKKHHRLLPFSQKVYRALHRYLEVWNPRTFLFEGREEGKPMTGRGIQSSISRLAREAGLEVRVTPGILRNSFAMHLLERGGSLEYVSHLLGHKNLSATRKFLLLAPLFKPTPALEDMDF